MTHDSLLAYVFWHWRQPSVDRDAYEAAQADFHRSLADAPPDGFVRSFSHAIGGAPWANHGGEAYEDWYLVNGTAALDSLEAGAVSRSRKNPHDNAAALAASGAAGLYMLRAGTPAESPRFAQWFSKPAGLTYGQLFAAVGPALAPVAGSLWMRKMVLGPSPEFCVLARDPAVLAPPFQALAVSLRPVWQGRVTAAR